MIESSFCTAAVNRSSYWTLMWTREPEPDLEHDVDTLDDPVVVGPSKPANKSPRLGPWILLLILLTVAGGTYLASDPSLLLDLVGQGPPSTPAPLPRAASDPAGAGPPPTDGVPTSGSVPQPTPSTFPITPQPASSDVPTPLFREGQRVTIRPDPTSPTGTLALMADAEGKRPGPMLRMGTTLTVLDAEFQNNAWMYSVRTEAGSKGWIGERRLIAK